MMNNRLKNKKNNYLEKNYDKKSEIPIEFRDHAWFLAIAPVDRPSLALAILIEHGGHGGRAAAPIAGRRLPNRRPPKASYRHKGRPCNSPSPQPYDGLGQ